MTIDTALFPYQQDAVVKLSRLKVGALYAEMGTGKTRMTLEIIQKRLNAGKIDRVLWLCPCSIRKSIHDDITYHCGSFPDEIRIDGIESLSSSIRLFTELSQYVTGFRVMLVVDESNLVKNPKAIRTQNVTRIAEQCPYRMILNGTPVSRSEADLFSQWYLLDWRILGYRSYYSFAANHLEMDPSIPGKVRRTLNTDYLVEKIAPYSFQIAKADCFELPMKHYSKLSYRMSDRQRHYYYDITDRLIEQMDEMKPSTVYRLFTAAQLVLSGRIVKDEDGHLMHKPLFASPYDNPRIQTLLDTIGWTGGEEKILVYAKYNHEIEDILSVLPDAVSFYGALTQKQRDENLTRFRTDINIMVANKTCAGYGLNLQHCHNVIYYSNDWDYATRIQSEDRVHRYGQTKPVFIKDICALESIDERILRCIDRKESLSESVKRELNRANADKEAKGEFCKWLHGQYTENNNENIHE